MPTFAGSIGPRTVRTLRAARCFGTGWEGEVNELDSIGFLGVAIKRMLLVAI